MPFAQSVNLADKSGQDELVFFVLIPIQMTELNWMLTATPRLHIRHSFYPENQLSANIARWLDKPIIFLYN
jgi:hypothetical protein